MGMKSPKTIYISDRGKEFILEDMASSHLLNAIHHHHTQLHTVGNIIERRNEKGLDSIGNLDERRGGLTITLQALMDELAVRSLEDDAKREVDSGYDNDRY